MINLLSKRHLLSLILLLGLLSGCGNLKNTDRKAPYVVVLGIAQDAGFPQAACTKPCCKAVWSGKIEPAWVSCLGLVDPISNQAWLIDATPDFTQQWQVLQSKHTHDLQQPNGIFLTHAHMGHYAGLLDLGREAMGADGVNVYAMPRLDSFLQKNAPWSQLVDLQNISIQLLTEEKAVALTQEVRVTPFLVPHRDEFSETVGYKIEGPNQSLLFIPDIDKWEKWDHPIEQMISTVDYALLDGTFYADYELPNRDMSEIPHPFIIESIKRFEQLPIAEQQKISFIHLNHTNPLLQPTSIAIKELCQTPFGLAQRGQVFGL